MGLSKKIDPLLKTNNDTGFGTNAANVGGRFINRDGTFNIRKEGLTRLERYSIFHHMLTLPRWRFATVIFVFYLTINLVFASPLPVDRDGSTDRRDRLNPLGQV